MLVGAVYHSLLSCTHCSYDTMLSCANGVMMMMMIEHSSIDVHAVVSTVYDSYGDPCLLARLSHHRESGMNTCMQQ